MATPAAHASTVILDVGSMDAAGRRTVNIAGIGAAYADPIQFKATSDGAPVNLLAWCVDVYHHITLADYSPNLIYTDTAKLQTDFATTAHGPNLLDPGDVTKIGLLANYGQAIFDKAPVAPAAFTELLPIAPIAPVAPILPIAPKAPVPPVAPTVPPSNASAAVKKAYAAAKAAYDLKKTQYDSAKAIYDTANAAYMVQKAAYDLAKTAYDLKKTQYDADKAAYTLKLAAYNADKAAHDLAVTNYNAAVAARYTTLAAVQSAIWQVASNLDVTSTNHDAGFDLLVDHLSSDNLTSYFVGYGADFRDFTLITPVQQFTSKGAKIALTQSFVFAIGAIPEPATWALMIGGFGLVGASLRRRRVGAALTA